MTAPTRNASRKTKMTAIGELPGDWDVVRLHTVIKKIGSGVTPLMP